MPRKEDSDMESEKQSYEERMKAIFKKASAHLLLNLSPEEMDSVCQCGSSNHRATDGCIPRAQQSESRTNVTDEPEEAR